MAATDVVTCGAPSTVGCKVPGGWTAERLRDALDLQDNDTVTITIPAAFVVPPRFLDYAGWLLFWYGRVSPRPLYASGYQDRTTVCSNRPVARPPSAGMTLPKGRHRKTGTPTACGACASPNCGADQGCPETPGLDPERRCSPRPRPDAHFRVCRQVGPPHLSGAVPN